MAVTPVSGASMARAETARTNATRADGIVSADGVSLTNRTTTVDHASSRQPAPSGPPDRGELATYARLQHSLYYDTVVDGWERLPAGSLAVSERDPKSGFEAAVFRSTRLQEPRHVVVFAGTNDGRDWITNAKNFLGIGGVPTQYVEARELGRAARAAFGDDVHFVGHSLGGGLATYAGLDAGVPTTVFNAAGIGSEAQRDLEGSSQLGAADRLITNVNVRSEFLSTDSLVTTEETPKQLGRVFEIDSPEPGWDIASVVDSLDLGKRVRDHSIDRVLQSLGSGRPLTTPEPSDPFVVRMPSIDSIVPAAAGEYARLRNTVGDGRALPWGKIFTMAGAVTELIEGDARVQALAVRGERREAVRAMTQTVGAVIGTVVSDVVSLGGRLGFVKNSIVGHGLTEAMRGAGDAVGRGINTVLFVKDR